MKIVISGASGLIGSRLVPHLEAAGHEVFRLVRKTPSGSREIQWNPATGELDPAAIDGMDAVINLSGAGVGDKRWNDAYKREIMNSRVSATLTLARAIAQSTNRPSVFLSGSAIGIYGDRGSDNITETSKPAHTFLADVVQAWEAAAAPAQAAGVRVAFLRTGLVLAPSAGAFAKLIPLFKLGLGGVIGNGKQYWPIISLTDEVRAIEFLLHHPVSGAVNLTAPSVPTNRQVTQALGQALKRPTLLPVPAFALKIVLGEFADEITTGAKVLPHILSQLGFEWKHPTVAAAIDAEILKRTQ